jgi:hypothetical protein
MQRHSLRMLGGAAANGELSLPRLPTCKGQRVFAYPRRRWERVHLLRGACKQHASLADTGNTATREFCNCGSPLFARTSARPDVVAVKAASLDDPTWFVAEADVWVASAQPWDHMDPGVPKFPANRLRAQAS